MCGSIIGTLTLSLKQEIRESKSRLLPFVFNYNLGRITSYTIAGLLAGILESVLSWPFGDGHGHRYLQLFSALIMACAGLYIAGWFPRFAYLEKMGVTIWKQLEPMGRRLIPVQSLSQAYTFGMIWGWLPCGLVYAALALSAATGDVTRSALTMLFFGLGTLPAVFSLGIMTNYLTKLSRMRRFKWFVGISLIALALVAAFPEINPMRMDSEHALH
jgi:sulfite exporter TauE/SafE